MTKPTQAQIEAAAKAAFAAACDEDDGYDWEDYIPVALAALTAAAGVGPTQAQIEAAELCAMLDKIARRFGARFVPDQRKVAAYVTALTAAAEPDHAAEASAYLRDKARTEGRE